MTLVLLPGAAAMAALQLPVAAMLPSQTADVGPAGQTAGAQVAGLDEGLEVPVALEIAGRNPADETATAEKALAWDAKPDHLRKAGVTLVLLLSAADVGLPG